MNLYFTSSTPYPDGWHRNAAGIKHASIQAINFLRGFTLIFLFPLLLLAKPARAQKSEWQWALQSMGSGTTQVKNSAVDATGNFYKIRFITETAYFGATTLARPNNSGLFGAQLSAADSWEWAVFAGDPQSDHVSGVAVVSTGRVVVAGSSSRHVCFGTTTLSRTIQGR